MSFREKSAWAMALVLLVTGLFYLKSALAMPVAHTPLAQIGPLVPYVVAVIILSIVVQIALSIASPKEAGRPADEREHVVIDKAGNWAGMVLGVLVVTSVLHYIWWDSVTLLVQGLFGALIVSQLADNLFQIVLFRRGF